MAEDLREVLREGDLFEVEESSAAAPWTHEVFYEDVLAHEFEESVERSAAFLRAVDGVRDAVHEDRERLLVAAPGVASAQLKRQLRAFWRSEASRRPAWADAVEAAVAALAPELKAAGFRKQKARWNRAVEDDIVHVLELNTYDNGEGRHFELSLGVFVPALSPARHPKASAPKWVREHDCTLRVSSWTLRSDRHAGAWPLTGGPEPVVAFAREVALPFLDTRTTVATLVEADAAAPPGAQLHPADAAIALVQLGRREEAQRRMDEAFVRSPHAYEHLRALARAIGLKAPETPPPIEEPAPSRPPPRTRWFRWRRS